MNKEELIQEATRRGLVPGVTVESIFGTVGVLPPHDKWYTTQVDLFARCPDVGALGVRVNGNWATLVSPACEGLEEGMAVECGPAMRAAILESAANYGIRNRGVPESEKNVKGLVYVSEGNLCTVYGFPGRTMLAPSEFLRRLEHTKPAQPKITVTSNGKEVEAIFTADGIEVNGSCVSRKQVLEVADRLEGKKPKIDWRALAERGGVFPNPEMAKAAYARIRELGAPCSWTFEEYPDVRHIFITGDGALSGYRQPQSGNAPYGAFMDAIEALAPKPLSIGGYPVEVREKDVKIGCTVATHEVVRAVAERLKR